MGLTIRDAQAADAEPIAGLLAQLGYPTEANAVGSRLERLRIVGDRVVVAELDGAAVGLAHLQVVPAIEHERPVARIAALVVDAQHRGRGIGRALVEELEAEARARGCGLLFLTTSELRDDAHAFYEQLGFVQSGRRYGRTLSV
jgi:GNAT superfamily N-acetyltransferase